MRAVIAAVLRRRHRFIQTGERAGIASMSGMYLEPNRMFQCFKQPFCSDYRHGTRHDQDRALAPDLQLPPPGDSGTHGGNVMGRAYLL